jgi:hypothetical protein
MSWEAWWIRSQRQFLNLSADIGFEGKEFFQRADQFTRAGKQTEEKPCLPGIQELPYAVAPMITSLRPASSAGNPT